MGRNQAPGPAGPGRYRRGNGRRQGTARPRRRRSVCAAGQDSTWGRWRQPRPRAELPCRRHPPAKPPVRLPTRRGPPGRHTGTARTSFGGLQGTQGRVRFGEGWRGFDESTGHRLRCARAGCDEYAPRPIRRTRLDRLASVARGFRHPAPDPWMPATDAAGIPVRPFHSEQAEHRPRESVHLSTLPLGVAKRSSRRRPGCACNGLIRA